MSPLQVWLTGLVRRSEVSQRDLAMKSGMSEKHVSQMLNGRVEGSVSAWSKLLVAADALRIEATGPVNATPDLHLVGALIPPAGEVRDA